MDRALRPLLRMTAATIATIASMAPPAMAIIVRSIPPEPPSDFKRLARGAVMS